MIIRSGGGCEVFGLMPVMQVAVIVLVLPFLCCCCAQAELPRWKEFSLWGILKVWAQTSNTTEAGDL